MTEDLQIIDGFESLRAAFIAANPGVPLGEPARREHSSGVPSWTTDEVLEAWLAVILNWDGRTSQQRRMLRSLVRIARQSDETTDDANVSQLLAQKPQLIADARQALESLKSIEREGRVRLKENPPTLAAEAQAWSKLLPKLRGMKSWRLLKYLDRPVIVPEPQVRRFLWRLGLIRSENAETDEGLAEVTARIEEIQRLTAFQFSELELLFQWHLGPTAWDGGNRCIKVPQCHGCAMNAGCAWYRFHRNDPAPADAAPKTSELTGIKRRMELQEADGLDDPELLALILSGGGAHNNALELAENLLRRFGGFKGLQAASIAELQQIKGIGLGKALLIKSSMELGRRLMSQPLRQGDSMGGSMDVWLAFRSRYRHVSQEHFITLLLDTKNRFMESCIVTKGTLNGSLAHPREVFKHAIRQCASAIILMHNHPSGDPTPSREDVSVTTQIVESGKILGIRVLDHIILGSETYFSFKDEGKI